jgi:AcrR family transcriptional regulator
MLEAASRLFSKHRFHQVRMEDVAAEAGVGKGTIYRYFDDKDELYLALLERAGRLMSERIQKRIATARSPLEKLEGLAAAVLEFFDEQPHVFDLIQRADAQRGAANPWKKTRDEAMRLVTDFIAEGQKRGDFTVEDPSTVGLILSGGLRAVVRFGSRPHAPDLARRIVRVVLFGAAQQ